MEMGYYVFPVAIVDQFLKDNGLPGPGEMHQAPLNKLAEIFGTDSVLYITLLEYGTQYQVLNSAATAHAKAKLVDAKSGTLLWEGKARADQTSGGGGGGLIGALVQAAVTQVVSSTRDDAHTLSKDANTILLRETACRPLRPMPTVLAAHRCFMVLIAPKARPAIDSDFP